jgi:alkaline phosphatase
MLTRREMILGTAALALIPSEGLARRMTPDEIYYANWARTTAAWKELGVNLGDDMHPKMITFTFPKMLKLKPTETAWFSFITYKSKAHRDSVNAKVMKEMSEKYKDQMNQPMPFDMKRMATGGFRTIVQA